MALEFLKKLEFKKPKELIGVDIGTTSIKIALLKNSKDGFTIECIDQKTYEESLLSDGCIIDTSFIANELKEIISRNDIKTKEAACALSSYSVISKKVAMPFLKEEELENSISIEVESVIPFPLKDIYYSYYVIGVAEEKQDMMDVQVVAAKKEIIDGYIKNGEISHLYEDFIYNISSEISKTINFYTSTKTRERIDKIYLTGGTSTLKGLKETIQENAQIDVEFINPFLLVNEDIGRIENYKNFRESIAVALYLSSRAVDILVQ